MSTQTAEGSVLDLTLVKKPPQRREGFAFSIARRIDLRAQTINGVAGLSSRPGNREAQNAESSREDAEIIHRPLLCGLRFCLMLYSRATETRFYARIP